MTEYTTNQKVALLVLLASIIVASLSLFSYPRYWSFEKSILHLLFLAVILLGMLVQAQVEDIVP